VYKRQVLFSIIMFGLIYLMLGVLYVFILARNVKRGPGPLPAKEVR